MANQMITVSQLNGYIKKLVASDPNLTTVYVKGELSNCKVHYSGHIYFTLKDEGAAVRCVMFKSNAAKLNFVPKDGMKLLVSGRIDVFERDGQYQLYAQHMVVDGVGSLAVAYEQLKEKLYHEGLFHQEHKKKIPQFPKKVGVVTASTGAALRDILNIIERRCPYAQVVVYPVLVQGEKAPKEIVAAIDYFSQSCCVDTVIIGRGGGSIEDLWAFNDEGVARAIYRCAVPIISAVGHETDITISDYVADLRAPTPSAAAELCVPDLERVYEQIEDVVYRLKKTMANKIEKNLQRLQYLMERRAMKEASLLTKEQETKLLLLTDKLTSITMRSLEGKEHSLQGKMEKLDTLSPLSVLKRGYAIVLGEDEQVIGTVKKASTAQSVQIVLKDGRINAKII